jgi:O-antigen biosynthesis protein
MTCSFGTSPRASILIVCHRRVDLLVGCLDSLRRNVTDEVAAETIVLFNGTRGTDREHVRPALRDVRVLVSAVNLGFGGGVNRAAAQAAGEYLVMVNDDVEVEPGWLESLVATADVHPNAGAVGSRILHPDGTLQEAGSVIWRDGSTLGVGRGLSAGSRRYDYLREVDYASACSLLVRRETFERLGGFDERFFPGYNEDVDLCLAIRRRHQCVLYQPRSVVMHHESRSGVEAKTFLIHHSRRLLREKWAAELDRFPEPPRRDERAIELAVHRARRSPRRVLIIDDRVPDPGLGSGFGRMLDAMRELAAAGYAITLHPTATAAGERRELQDLGVEVIEHDLIAHVSAPVTFYDVSIVSRPHNFKLVRLLRRHQPHCAIIYDAEAVFHRRFEREAELLRTADPRGAELALFEAEQARRLERRVVREVDRVVSVSTVEAKLLKSVPGHRPVDVIEPRSDDPRLTPRPFAQRTGMVLVAGWLASYPSPNTDGLEWFVGHILPLLKRRLPWARLSVTGANPPDQVTQLAGPSLRFLGHIEDLTEVYDRARVAVVPVRYGAGIKIKALEALEHGVPVVTTTVGAEGIEGAGGPAVAVSDDPAVFAEHVVTLLDDLQAWEIARAAIAEIHARWRSSPQRSWTAIVDTALMEKTIGSLALQR